jgi:hypothetical protein
MYAYFVDREYASTGVPQHVFQVDLVRLRLQSPLEWYTPARGDVLFINWVESLTVVREQCQREFAEDRIIGLHPIRLREMDSPLRYRSEPFVPRSRTERIRQDNVFEERKRIEQQERLSRYPGG